MCWEEEDENMLYLYQYSEIGHTELAYIQIELRSEIDDA